MFSEKMDKQLIAAALVLFMGCGTTQAFAQEEGDYSEMSLEALLSVKLTRGALLDIHHTHPKGEWMISYKYMYMDMTGNRSGTIRQSEEEVLQDYMVAPVHMVMQMHMIGVMYAPANRLTLMAMVPFRVIWMRHITRKGNEFAAESRGLGDPSITALYSIYEDDAHRLIVNAGLSIPLGSIDERDDLPMGDDRPLAYPMQLGSGSLDPMLGFTYIGLGDDWSWGAHLKGTFRLSNNSNSYRVGNEQRFTTWVSHTWNDWFSTNLRLDGRNRQDFSGSHPDLNPMMVPTADPRLRAGRRVSAGLGFNLHPPHGMLEGHQFSVEAGIPFYQNLDGPQLERDFHVRAGWFVVF